MISQSPLRHNALLGKPVAEEITRAVYNGVEDLAAKGWPVKLVSITIGDVPAVSLYVRNQARAKLPRREPTPPAPQQPQNQQNNGESKASRRRDRRKTCRAPGPAFSWPKTTP